MQGGEEGEGVGVEEGVQRPYPHLYGLLLQYIKGFQSRCFIKHGGV